MNLKWVVELGVAPTGDGSGVPPGEQLAIDLLLFMQDLVSTLPSISCRPGYLGVRWTIFADTPQEAARRVFQLWEKAQDSVPALSGWGQLVTFSIESEEEAKRSVDRYRLPRMLGVAELAQLLGVSKPRARQVARLEGFPPPAARLAATPVWDTDSVQAFVTQWRSTAKNRRRLSRGSVAPVEEQTRTFSGDLPQPRVVLSLQDPQPVPVNPPLPSHRHRPAAGR